jgi:tetratricopeptide (TPR) repeat protein
MRRTASSAVALLLVAALGARPAVAAPSEADREARRAFKNAEEHFRAGMFAEALSEYQGGYDASPLPGFLINIAQCQRRLGDLRKARATYQKFIMVAPDSPHVSEVTTLIGELDKLIADLDRAGSETAGEETGSAAQRGAAPTPVPAASPPPPAASGSALAIASPAAGAEPKPSRGRRWWLWGLVGVVAVGAGATIAALALSSPATTTLHDGSLGTLRR